MEICDRNRPNSSRASALYSILLPKRKKKCFGHANGIKLTYERIHRQFVSLNKIWLNTFLALFTKYSRIFTAIKQLILKDAEPAEKRFKSISRMIKRRYKEIDTFPKNKNLWELLAFYYYITLQVILGRRNGNPAAFGKPVHCLLLIASGTKIYISSSP